jgi:hypothetical protein
LSLHPIWYHKPVRFDWADIRDLFAIPDEVPLPRTDRPQYATRWPHFRTILSLILAALMLLASLLLLAMHAATGAAAGPDFLYFLILIPGGIIVQHVFTLRRPLPTYPRTAAVAESNATVSPAAQRHLLAASTRIPNLLAAGQHGGSILMLLHLVPVGAMVWFILGIAGVPYRTPLALLFPAASMLPAIAVCVAMNRLRLRLRAGHCFNCDYDLKRLRSGESGDRQPRWLPCPECGELNPVHCGGANSRPNAERASRRAYDRPHQDPPPREHKTAGPHGPGVSPDPHEPA